MEIHHVSIVAVIITLATASGIEIPSWSYDINNVLTWPSKWPGCGSKYQDPVDIPFETILGCFQPLHWVNLDWPQRNVLFTNTYRTLQIHLDPRYPVLVAGGPLAANTWYYGFMLTFSFGHNDTVGSDKTIRGRSYPMEIKLYASVDRNFIASDVPNSGGLTVLSWMVEVSPKDNPAWKPLISNLHNIQDGGTQTFGTLGTLRSLLPSYEDWQNDYFTYLGAQSTPPCAQDVTRVVFTTKIPLSSSQIAAFRQLNNEKGESVSKQNYKRPQASPENRQYFRSFY